jgi:hypothetical protein
MVEIVYNHLRDRSFFCEITRRSKKKPNDVADRGHDVRTSASPEGSVQTILPPFDAVINW